mmetsp:Transcript_34747/g.74008  ORF Transcript_34747/g.74008 Transcript_34747/m.74008 type:complete len:232 (+) Transcript_34747:3-698(+)
MTMTSWSTVGSREIEAANQRLAAAKAWAASAAQQMNAATKGVDVANAMLDRAKKNAETAQKNAEAAESTKENAQSQLENSKEKVKEAEEFLKEAERRWEVIDIDADDAEYQENGRRKKPKVGAKMISVEGGGSSEVNGTYRRSEELYDGAHVYCKRGRWRRKAVEFQIWFERHDEGKLGSWVIGCIDEDDNPSAFYMAADFDGATLPPNNGWEICPNGEGDAKEPAPRLKY